MAEGRGCDDDHPFTEEWQLCTCLKRLRLSLTGPRSTCLLPWSILDKPVYDFGMFYLLPYLSNQSPYLSPLPFLDCSLPSSQLATATVSQPSCRPGPLPIHFPQRGGFLKVKRGPCPSSGKSLSDSYMAGRPRSRPQSHLAHKASSDHPRHRSHIPLAQ